MRGSGLEELLRVLAMAKSADAAGTALEDLDLGDAEAAVLGILAAKQGQRPTAAPAGEAWHLQAGDVVTIGGPVWDPDRVMQTRLRRV